MSLIHELKLAVRHLLKSPGFSITAVLMLALGIGATTAIFSLLDGVLLRPLPFPDSDKLVVISDMIQGADVGGNGEAGVTVPDIRNYTRETHSFSNLGGYQQVSNELSGSGDPAAINVTRMTSGIFPALHVGPLVGRFFTEQENTQHEAVAVLSYATWQSRFHGDAGILGRKILLDRKPYVVIGVMPRNFEFPLMPGHLNRTELWVPFSLTEQELAPSSAANWTYNMVGRLKAGVSLEEALADARQVAAETVRNYPAFMAGFSIRPVVRPLHEETVERARPLVRTLFFAVTVVLLIACANLAGLLLVRAIRRRREVAVRLALGARAITLLRQAVLESLTLSVTGGLIGVGLAAAALKVGISLLPETLPRIAEIGLNWPVLLFALALAVVTGLLCGLVPAFAAIRTNVNDTLKEGGRTGTSGGGHGRLRSALVIAEVAVAVVLLTVAGLLLRSFQKMREVDLGYQPDNLLVAAYSLPPSQYGTQIAVDRFNLQLLQRLRALPGVSSVGLADLLPASAANSNSAFLAEGFVAPKAGTLNLATTIGVQGDYLRAMKVPLLRGRLFTEADTAAAPLVSIVNRQLADQTWPGQDPVGKRLRIGTETMDTPWVTVIGEVAAVKEGSPDQPASQQFYIPYLQELRVAGSAAPPTLLEGNSGYIVVRTAVEPEQMETTLRQSVRELDAQLPLTQLQTMEHAVAETEAPRRFNTALITIFAGTALLLAVLGLYSITAFSVASRVPEIAIRMALGSQRSGIVRLVLASGARLAIAGCAIGLLGAMGAAKLARSLLFGVSALDPLVLALCSLLVLLLAFLACVLPARRAASVDPVQSLRGE